MMDSTPPFLIGLSRLFIYQHPSNKAQGPLCTTCCFTPPSPTMPNEKIRYRCTHGSCERTYVNASSLSGHIKRAHLEAGQDFPCHKDNCQKVYSSSKGLQTHLHKVHGTYACTIKDCGQEIEGKEAYQDHLATHAIRVHAPLLFFGIHNQEQPKRACQEEAHRCHAVSKCTERCPGSKRRSLLLPSQSRAFGRFKYMGKSSCCKGTGTVRHKENLARGIPLPTPIGSAVVGRFSRGKLTGAVC